jgi:hypothetical protein
LQQKSYWITDIAPGERRHDGPEEDFHKGLTMLESIAIAVGSALGILHTEGRGQSSRAPSGCSAAS